MDSLKTVQEVMLSEEMENSRDEDDQDIALEQ